MIRFFILKFKSGVFISLLAVLNLFAILFVSSCCECDVNNKKENNLETIKRSKKTHDSIVNEKRIKDSISNVQRKSDSIAKADSIKKSKRIYEHKIQNTKYGVVRTDFKEM
ncbi:MAG: hypothetical protein HXX09_16760 [Bacteroidetes bacterium]|nr:hypothetical protein [Bacteroidota bacterium]